MMPELSLNVLDVTENSTRAGATLVEISVLANSLADTLTITIKDNGCGMTAEQVASVEDPFFTTRTTRKVGLGVPFFKMAALCTDGDFRIDSTLGVGTTVTAIFGLSHIDRMPLGDMVSTIHTLITMHDDIDFVYQFAVDDREFTLDTREFREILGDVSYKEPEVSTYIKEFLKENEADVLQGQAI